MYFSKCLILTIPITYFNKLFSMYMFSKKKEIFFVDVSPSMLETVIPRDESAFVMIVQGKYSGEVSLCLLIFKFSIYLHFSLKPK